MSLAICMVCGGCCAKLVCFRLCLISMNGVLYLIVCVLCEVKVLEISQFLCNYSLVNDKLRFFYMTMELF